MEEHFPKNITDQIRECILAIFWPKAEIISFFQNNNCDEDDLADVEEFPRYKLVSVVIERLHQRKDAGLGQFRRILKSLIEWESFDPVFFEKYNKLELSKAKKSIQQLKDLQEMHDTSIRITHNRREEHKNKNQNEDELKRIFYQLLNCKDINGNEVGFQKRGYLFEGFLKKLFIYEGVSVTEAFSYSIQGEQIDGCFKFEGENYIIEAKWTEKEIASNALYHFSYKVEGKMYGRGVFISVNGFSKDSVEQLVKGKALRAILMDGEDLMHITDGRFSLKDVLDRKIKAAQVQGYIDIDPYTGKSKI